MGEVRYSADIKVGAAGRRGAFATFVMEADIPAVLRQGPFRPSEANWIASVKFREFGTAGSIFPFMSARWGVFASGQGTPRVDRGPRLAASFAEWAVADICPELAN